jgi:Fe2+ transport system protein FeoA
VTGGAPEDDAVVIPLDRIQPGESGTIVRVDGDPAIARRLMELGFVTGTEVNVLRRAPFGDPIEMAVRGVHLWLRRTEASSIHVAVR